MAQSDKTGGGTILTPMLVVGALVIVVLVGFFVFTGERPQADNDPASSTEVDQRPTGAGTKPEGQVDQPTEGVTDMVDRVDPAAPGVDTVPAAQDGEGGADAASDAQQSASEPAPGDGTETAGSGSSQNASQGGEDEEGAAESFLLDEEADDTAEPVDQAGQGDAQGYPQGRDAQTDLTVDPGQDVVDDTDEGGTSFVPTPSGPEGRDDSALTAE